MEANLLWRGEIGDLYDANSIVDAAGNRFVGVRVLNGNETWVYIRRYERSGEITGTWTVTAPGGAKLDSAHLDATGDTLLVTVTAHSIEGERFYVVGSASIEGVFAPYEGLQRRTGAPGAYVGGSQQVAEVDYERIEGMVNAAADRVLAETANMIRAAREGWTFGLASEVKNAMLDLINPGDTRDRERDYKHYWWRFMRDRVYEVLKENGLIK